MSEGNKGEEAEAAVSDNHESGDEAEEDKTTSPSKEKKNKKDKKDKKDKKKSKKSKKEGESENESEQEESEEEKKKSKKKKKSSKKSTESEDENEDDEFDFIYKNIEKEPWEMYDSPENCIHMSGLNTAINSRHVNDCSLFESEDKHYRWAKLGEKGNQQMLIGPLYFLSMNDYQTAKYAEKYFYCATPKDHFTAMEKALNKQLVKAEQKFKSNGHNALQKKEIKCNLPAIERFRMGLIDAGETDEDKAEMKECTLVQFSLSMPESGTFSAIFGEEEVVLSEMFEKFPGLIGYANVTVTFSAEVLPYAEGDSDETDDDEKSKKSSSKKKKKKSKKKSVKQDPMDPSASCGKVGVKFKVACVSIVAPSIARAVPMSDSKSIEVVKPSSALMSMMKSRR